MQRAVAEPIFEKHFNFFNSLVLPLSHQHTAVTKERADVAQQWTKLVYAWLNLPHINMMMMMAMNFETEENQFGKVNPKYN